MELAKNNYNIISTILFLMAIVIAQISAPSEYDWTKNTLSDLGSQDYDKKWIMQTGFISFGLILSAGIFIHGLNWRTIPILIYALSVGLTGVFCTKPFFILDSYSTTESNIHSALAQIAGIAFTLGIVLQLFYTNNPNEKRVHFIFFILVTVLSASFGLSNNYPGIMQRLLYLISFIWLIKYYKP
jgi:hypothetical protein